MRGNPIPLFAGILSYQMTGWILGERIFESLNSEAMMFTFLLGSLWLIGWLYHKWDDYEYPRTMQGRLLFGGLVAVGIIVGAMIRIKTHSLFS